MPMTPFAEKFPELGPRETRFVIVQQSADLPAGHYGFLEFCCNEPECDCRRVIIRVLRPETGWRPWATIGYGWESLDFYRQWGGPYRDPVEMKGPALDPMNAQSKYAEALLDVFQTVLDSPGYIERLQRHYQMFRESVDKEINPRTRLRKTKPRRRRPR